MLCRTGILSARFSQNYGKITFIGINNLFLFQCLLYRSILCRDHKIHGTFVPENFRSLEPSFPGTFVP